jgi:hypothetical protein
MKTIVTGSGGAGNAAKRLRLLRPPRHRGPGGFFVSGNAYGCSSTARAPVSNTDGCRFESCRPCMPRNRSGNRSLLTPQWMTKMAQTSVRLRWVDRWTLDPEDRVRPPDGRRGCSTTAVRRLAMAETGVRLPVAALDEACRRSSVVERPPVERRAAGSIPVVGALFPWRSWTARGATNVEVAGSNPAGNAQRVVAQLGQRARFGTERTPVRIRPTRRAPLAQLVELPPLKRRVTGSSPVRRTAGWSSSECSRVS